MDTEKCQSGEMKREHANKWQSPGKLCSLGIQLVEDLQHEA